MEGEGGLVDAQWPRCAPVVHCPCRAPPREAPQVAGSDGCQLGGTLFHLFRMHLRSGLSKGHP